MKPHKLKKRLQETIKLLNQISKHVGKRKAKSARRKITFTDDSTVEQLPISKRQTMWWDTDTRGLHVLVSPGGAKSFRSQFKVGNNWYTRHLGRFGDLCDDDRLINLEWARLQCKHDRLDGSRGIDPRKINPRVKQ